MDISPDPGAFASELDRFSKLIAIHGDGEAFTSFRQGVADAEEGYKLKLRDHARQLLAIDAWSEADIGTGAILKATIGAIEIQKGPGKLVNNLVYWQIRRSPAAREHLALLEAVKQPALCHQLERLLFDLYRDQGDEGVVFEQLRVLLRKKYPLLAYLYFLKDMDRFMPIHPTRFGHAFRSLGIGLVMRGRCSWENYQAFNQALMKVRDMLAALPGLNGGVSLIDAHSFLWLLQTLKTPDQATPADRDRARRKSIEDMVKIVMQTVANSNGQIIERTVKNKDLCMTPSALSKLTETLLAKQEGRCAITGIPLQYKGLRIDPNLAPSLDRIDSDGHYEASNLQVVCRFVNFWKGASDDVEFRRLMKLIIQANS